MKENLETPQQSRIESPSPVTTNQNVDLNLIKDILSAHMPEAGLEISKNIAGKYEIIVSKGASTRVRVEIYKGKISVWNKGPKFYITALAFLTIFVFGIGIIWLFYLSFSYIQLKRKVKNILKRELPEAELSIVGKLPI